MPSIFTRIIRGEIPAHILAQDQTFIAFLDVNPLRQGHTLVVPVQEIDYLFDQPTEILCELLPFAKQVASAIQQVVPCVRVGLSVVGLEVPHAHVHLIPINKVSDMNFSQPKLPYNTQDFEAIAVDIRKAYQRI